MEMPLVRYYVYASDVKIDMIYSQIPPKLLSRIVGELKLDLKVLALSLRKRETDETLYSKLGVVENYLDNEFEVGSVAESGAWFRGALPMRSGVCAPGTKVSWAFVSEARPLLRSSSPTGSYVTTTAPAFAYRTPE